MFLNFDSVEVHYQKEYLLLDEKAHTQSPEYQTEYFFDSQLY